MTDPTNEFYLDGNVIVELDDQKHQFRFWPDDTNVRPDGREWELQEMATPAWKSVTASEFDEITQDMESAVTLDVEVSDGSVTLKRS